MDTNSPKKPNRDLDKIARRVQQTSRKRADKVAKTLSRHTKRFFVSRVEHLAAIRRPVIFWILAVGILLILALLQPALAQQDLTQTAPTSGGTYTEGVVDKVATLNPLFATTDSEIALSKLLYPGLLIYDSSNQLKGDLATTWSTENGKDWDVKLRDNIMWSDGQKLTADDVVFTVKEMKDPNLSSPLLNSWGAISVSKISDHEVKFTLPQPLVYFPSSLTFGILPKHVLDSKSPAEIRDYAGTNLSNLVVAGPFIFDQHNTMSDNQNEWSFLKNVHYFGGTVKISGLTLHTYSDTTTLEKALKSGEIQAAGGIDADTAKKSGLEISSAKLNAGVFAIFNTNSQITGDKNIREALRYGLNRDNVREASSVNSSKPGALETPLPIGTYSSVDKLKQPEFNLASAQKSLDDAGWKTSGADGARQKDGQELTLNVITVANSDYQKAAKNIVAQWKELGINVKLTAVNPSEIQSSYLATRDYDVLIYELNLGSDPDQLAYWGKAGLGSNGLNFSNYSDSRANLLLLSGRSQINSTTREQRYVAFVKQWQKDVPAIALYQPNYYYAYRPPLKTLDDSPLVSSAWRFRSVPDWTVRETTTNKTP